MSTSRILASSPREQIRSPLFSRLPAELRLMIYKFVFISCYATGWFDGEWGKNEYPWLREPRPRRFRSGACCFSHNGGAFSLLTSCKMAYIEAFGTYWADITLHVARSIATERIGCGLVSVCRYLPAAVKENLGDLRNVKLPILEVALSTPDDPTWTPALLRQLPKLRILVSTSFVLFGETPRKPFKLPIDERDHSTEFYVGLGPFNVSGEEPKQYIERKIGVQLSGGLMMVSKWLTTQSRGSRPGRKLRWCYINWTTGMMLQTTDVRQTLHAYEEVIEAKPGTRRRRWYGY